MADPTTPKKRTRLTRTCFHCHGVGTCQAAKTGDIVYSCEHCVKISGVAMNDVFPLVPCGYCKGKGFHSLLNDKKDGNEQKNQNFNKGGKRHGRR